MSIEQLLPFTLKTAKKAGEILLDLLNKPYKISYKEANERNLVTEADRASELFIITEINKSFPTHDILAEESGHHDNKNTEYRWIIDPIDGTNNFSHKHPFFAVSIGLEHQGEIIIGVVHSPFLQETFYAEKGKSAFLNEAPIQTSKVKTIKKSLTSTGFPPVNRQQNAPYFMRMLDASQGIRRCGAASIDLCYIACGRLDGFWEFGLAPWDIAAASLIIKEAGGKVSNLDGTPLDLYAKNILATNGIIHQEMQETLTGI